MQADNVEYLKVWKKNATAEERLLELAMMARKNPKKFTRMIVIFEEELAAEAGQTFPSTLTNYVTTAMCVRETLGLIEQGKFELLRHCYDIRTE